MFRLLRLLSSRRRTTSRADTTSETPSLSSDPFAFYEAREPSPQNALDLFKGRWSSAIPGYGMGTAELFNDARIEWFLAQYGDVCGKRILELGPLEAGHTF